MWWFLRRLNLMECAYLVIIFFFPSGYRKVGKDNMKENNMTKTSGRIDSYIIHVWEQWDLTFQNFPDGWEIKFQSDLQMIIRRQKLQLCRKGMDLNWHCNQIKCCKKITSQSNCWSKYRMSLKYKQKRGPKISPFLRVFPNRSGHLFMIGNTQLLRVV